MLIKINKQIEKTIEINFPYFTQSDNGNSFAHYSPNLCIMVGINAMPSITLLKHSNGLEFEPISETNFMIAFNEAQSQILSTLNQEKI